MSTSFTADEFVNVWVDAGDTSDDNEFYRQWSVHASAKHAAQPLQAANALKKAYPDHSLVLTFQNILNFPKALFSPLPDAPLVTKVMFIPGARNNGEATGGLIDQIDFGAFVGAWGNYDFLVYVVSYPSGFGTTTLYAILHQGPQDAARELILNAGLWNNSLHDEIWVYNQSFWRKDHALWKSIQTADWKDVILDDGFKKDLQKDIYGFFKSEPIYRDLAIPWKRGIIMHGPPGNGKTISIKVIMKTCDALGFAPLYVKSFQHYAGEEVAMQQVFDKARQLSPCVIVLEDLDALITDRNRSFFLNQLDGLQGNDGLLVIGTTNHFDRLDPGLSSRPSRFDRKYKFDDPTREERVLYVKYWQDKLESNKEIEFPDALVDEVADLTDQFSFAYLKEAFVSSLVTLAGYEGDDKPSFPSALKAQIKTLRKQLDKSTEAEAKRDFRPLFDNAAPVLSVFPPTAGPQQPSPTPGEPNFRALLDRLQQGRGNVPELMAQLEETRRAMMALSTPSAWDSSHTQIAGLAYYKAPTLN
ncbi:P-loop containing nucleoside triphosphate hydrolase protein [Mycena albidolilacea]|uniref:P-loop containing nucleoside triphosphate hydrolase protein n=1 Tax=Mycena albidolilacea TaxID=1033008 RepID=A0AAD7AV95_9AGAR|nr:P-loop containing nucleoside triphosphate hydrolase protein [Mycena albidolilacea]